MKELNGAVNRDAVGLEGTYDVRSARGEGGGNKEPQREGMQSGAVEGLWRRKKEEGRPGGGGQGAWGGEEG